MSNVRWSIVVDEETDRALRSYLRERGARRGELSRFVGEAVQARLLELNVREIKDRGQGVRRSELLGIIEKFSR